MESRKASWYSIVRYRADDLSGEIVNVGVVLHTLDGDGNALSKFLLVNENSAKIRAVTESISEVNIYKTYKEMLEYYLEESSKNLFGTVGKISIASPAEENFLEKLYDYYMKKQLFLTRPKFSLTNNLDRLFQSLFETYVGKKYLLVDHKQVSTKRYMKKLLEDRNLLNKKVISDYVIKPIDNLDNVKISVDFCYKNGLWNYMQVVPSISSPSKNTEWFAKTKFMFENLEKNRTVQLLYKNSDMKDQDFKTMLNYLSGFESNVEKLDIENERQMDNLFTKIANDAHDINKLLISWFKNYLRSLYYRRLFFPLIDKDIY